MMVVGIHCQNKEIEKKIPERNFIDREGGSRKSPEPAPQKEDHKRG
jgi:hypothetical protein